MYKDATSLKDVVFALMALIPIDHFSFHPLFKKISFNFEPSQDKGMESFFLNQALLITKTKVIKQM